MKKIIIFFMLFCAFTSGKSQTFVKLKQWGIDSLSRNYTCNKVMYFSLSCQGIAYGYSQSTDSIMLNMHFGDGVDTLFKATFFNDSVFYYNSFCVPHHYSSIGLVDIKLIAIAPDGQKDTMEINNFLIGDVCDSIKGSFYADANANCQLDIGENYLQNYYNLNLLYNNIDISSHLVYYHENHFSIFAPVDFTYDLIVSNNVNGIFCPAIRHINTTPSANNDFGYNCIGSFDLTGNIYGSQFRPGGTNALISIYACNFGCSTVNGDLKLIYDNTILTPTNSNYTYTVSGDTIIWNFTNLNAYVPNHTHFNPYVHFDVSTLAQVGDNVCFTILETPYTGDMDTTNNHQYSCWEINNSWDPNDKQVSPQGDGTEGFITNNQNMFYTVRFQNTGNDYAENVVILDTLDADLEIGTFSVLNSSHYMTTDIIGSNIVKFSFPNINLPDSNANQQASNGYVTYSIRQKPDLIPGTKITNTAFIYFDYNPAVVTNSTVNTIAIPTSVKEIILENEISVFPNPSLGIVHVTLGDPRQNCKIEILNSYGQLVVSREIGNTASADFDLSGRYKGIYFIKIQTENKVLAKKVIIE